MANTQGYLCQVFGLAKDKVEVLSPFMGGGFGCGLRPIYQVFLATMAAMELKRPVRLVLNREQMYSFGYRPGSIQTVALACDADGKLQGRDPGRGRQHLDLRGFPGALRQLLRHPLRLRQRLGLLQAGQD